MAFWTSLVAAAALRSFADATPIIAFPINSQVPPVARVSEPFSYTFAPSTFSDSSALTYSLSTSPSWLSLDSASRTLSGTPSEDDVTSDEVTAVPIELTASDSSGSIASTATLVISKNPAPAVTVPALAQLESFGSFSTPSTLLYNPSTAFDFHFDAETFGGWSNLSYYAVSNDNTPLPSWVSFDDSTFRFSGETPEYASLKQPPQTFGIQLIASDVEGFAGTSISFDIEVGVHLLAFTEQDLVINATTGTEVNFDGLSGTLQLDGKSANTSSLISVTASTPSWLSFDNTTFALSGTPPSDAVSSTDVQIVITAADVYGDTAKVSVSLSVSGISSGFFSGQFRDLNATIGKPFSYDLGTFVTNKTDIEMTAHVSPSTSWVSFDADTFVLSGTVPSRSKPSDLNITLSAMSKTSRNSESRSFELAVNTVGQTSSSSTSTSSASHTSKTGTSTSVASSTTSSGGLSKRIIAAIVVPIVVVLVALALCLFCSIRRKREAKNRYVSSPKKDEISRPIEIVSDVPDMPMRPPRTLVPPVQPLQLDTTGFMRDSSSVYSTMPNTAPQQRQKSNRTSSRYSSNRSSQYNSEPNFTVHNSTRKSLRRSQTVSATSNGIDSARYSQSSSHQRQAKSENGLSNSEQNRISYNSSGPTTSSGTNSSHRLTRTYSNFSRKGHRRTSSQLLPDRRSRFSLASPILSDTEGSILNLRDRNFSKTPLENFSVLSENSSLAGTPELMKSPQQMRLRPKTSARPVPGIDHRRSGIGHGARNSVSSLGISNGNAAKRRSIGHGQDWLSGSAGNEGENDPGLLTRESKTWLTVNSAGTRENERRSDMSSTSNYSDVYREETINKMRQKRKSMRAVPKSPPPSLPTPPSSDTRRVESQDSSSSRTSRPISRRITTSPFFGGSTRRSSLMSKQRTLRTSYADSPTVPQEARMASPPQHPAYSAFTANKDKDLKTLMAEDRSPPRDGLGILYGGTEGKLGYGAGAAKEGTRQLRSFIERIRGRKTSVKSGKSGGGDSKDSRFESASSLPASSAGPSRPATAKTATPREAEQQRHDAAADDENWLDDESMSGSGSDDDDASWETQLGDTKTNLETGLHPNPRHSATTQKGDDEARGRGKIKDYLGIPEVGAPGSPLGELFGDGARMMEARGKRPVSVQSGRGERGSKGEMGDVGRREESQLGREVREESQLGREVREESYAAYI